jgi:ATP-dependent RNA helicase DHX57
MLYLKPGINQVHERSVDSDFLLLELKELLKKDQSLKIVLMSATINQQTFVDYFGGAALVTIPGRTHPVQDSYVPCSDPHYYYPTFIVTSYLEDIIPRISYTPSFFKPAQKRTEEKLSSFRQMYESQGLDAPSVRTLEVITRADRFDYQVSRTLSYLSHSLFNPSPMTAYLVRCGVHHHQ